jgi:hypothetical protein
LKASSSVRLLLSFGIATASIISLLLAIINHLFTNTYKTSVRTVDQEVESLSPFGQGRQIIKICLYISMLYDAFDQLTIIYFIEKPVGNIYVGYNYRNTETCGQAAICGQDS